MNCEKFMNLTEPEQKAFLGKAIHAIISTNVGFDSALDIIDYAEQKGHFDNVKIGHEAINDDGNDYGIDRNGYELPKRD